MTPCIGGFINACVWRGFGIRMPAARLVVHGDLLLVTVDDN